MSAFRFPSINANNVSAACAAFTFFIGLPASVISCWQAFAADERADRAEAALNEIRDLAKSTKDLADSARDQVEIARSNALSANVAAQAAKDNAGAAQTQAGYAGLNAASAQGLRNETGKLADLAAGAAKQQAIQYAEVSRARISPTGVELVSYAIGGKTFIKFHFMKSGQVEPTRLRMWSQFLTDSRPNITPVAPACGVGSGWSDAGNWNLGVFDSIAKQSLSAEQASAVKRFGGFYGYGALCYDDGRGATRRTDFCSFVRPEEQHRRASACGRTPPPT